MQLTERPPVKTWTLEEYYEAIERGMFARQRLELIGGEILQMTPQGGPHFMAISLIEDALREAFGRGFWVRVQGPLKFRESASSPEPDVSVVRGRARDYPDHPTTALLIVEISDDSLRYDRGQKASLYAANGIEDYWVLDLNARRLHVLRGPIADARERFGFRYGDSRTLSLGDAVTPLAAPSARVSVEALLP
jgi:Uma2 family endonuclease